MLAWPDKVCPTSGDEHESAVSDPRNPGAVTSDSQTAPIKAATAAATEKITGRECWKKSNVPAIFYEV